MNFSIRNFVGAVTAALAVSGCGGAGGTPGGDVQGAEAQALAADSGNVTCLASTERVVCTDEAGKRAPETEDEVQASLRALPPGTRLVPGDQLNSSPAATGTPWVLTALYKDAFWSGATRLLVVKAVNNPCNIRGRIWKVPDLRAWGFNDATSSIETLQGCTTKVFWNINYGGVSAVFVNPSYVGNYWNDAISSFQVLSPPIITSEH